MKIGIAGAGGLGSNIAMHLVRSGVKNLKIVDFDMVDKSNLNRQFFFADQIGIPKVEALQENLRRIHADLAVEVLQAKIDSVNISQLFADCDLIVEALDKAEYKAIVVAYGIAKQKLTVAASGIAHHDMAGIEVRNPRPKLFVVGDFTKDIEQYHTYSAKVGVVAATMANVVLEQGGLYG